MTDKERIEVYVNELPEDCIECRNTSCIHHNFIANMFTGEVGRHHNCPLKTIQSVQNQKAVEALERVKERVKALRDLEISAVRESREFDFKTEEARLEWIKMKTESSKIYNSELKVIDNLIKEYGGKDE